jgi:hypothetical protein
VLAAGSAGSPVVNASDIVPLLCALLKKLLANYRGIRN